LGFGCVGFGGCDETTPGRFEMNAIDMLLFVAAVIVAYNIGFRAGRKELVVDVKRGAFWRDQIRRGRA
jgi:hypothetical protein